MKNSSEVLYNKEDMLQEKYMPYSRVVYSTCALCSTLGLYADRKTSWFLGICLWISGKGLEVTFSLMNTVEEERIEISFEFYNTQIQQIEMNK